MGVPKDFDTFQWHNDCFDVPAAAVCLASSPACAHQAFRYGTNLYGLQFHPEVTKEIIASWIEGSEGKNDYMQILEDFVCAEETYRKVSRRLLENFLRIAQLLP
jgi:GMP synthase-like glutamine amidotransferase